MLSRMTTAEQQLEDVETELIFEWRFGELQRAGYSPADAWTLADHKHVDVRLAERLLARGCPRSTALRILL